MSPARAARLVASFVAALTCACGTDVDLGGASDGAASSPDAACVCISADGGERFACSALAAPTTSAPCRACNPSSSTCQTNGCYGGFWCDVPARDCAEPPRACN